MIFGQESETLAFKKTTREIKEAAIDVAAILNMYGKYELYFGVWVTDLYKDRRFPHLLFMMPLGT